VSLSGTGFQNWPTGDTNDGRWPLQYRLRLSFKPAVADQNKFISNWLCAYTVYEQNQQDQDQMQADYMPSTPEAIRYSNHETRILLSNQLETT